jgi:hypothetical protein
LTDWSPNQIDHVFDFLTGGIGRFVKQTADLGVSAADGTLGEKDVTHVPVINAFVGAFNSDRKSGNYYEGRDEAFTVQAELDKAVENRAREEVARIRKENAATLRVVPRLKSIENERRKVAKRIREIEASTRTDAEKQRLVKIQKERQKELVSRGNKVLAELDK